MNHCDKIFFFHFTLSQLFFYADKSWKHFRTKYVLFTYTQFPDSTIILMNEIKRTKKKTNRSFQYLYLFNTRKTLLVVREEQTM